MDPDVQRTINHAIEHGELVEFYAAADACLVVSCVPGEGVRAPRRPGDPGPQLHERNVPLRLSPGGSGPASDIQPKLARAETPPGFPLNVAAGGVSTAG